MTQREPLVLHHPGNLRVAVRRVIQQNKSLGYNPNRFIQATASGEHPNLVVQCANLITNPETFMALDKVMQQHGDLLTLEDYVMRWGSEWGFNTHVIDHARERSSLFDRIAGRKRYASENEASFD